MPTSTCRGCSKEATPVPQRACRGSLRPGGPDVAAPGAARLDGTPVLPYRALEPYVPPTRRVNFGAGRDGTRRAFPPLQESAGPEPDVRTRGWYAGRMDAARLRGGTGPSAPPLSPVRLPRVRAGPLRGLRHGRAQRPCSGPGAPRPHPRRG